ncbi:MAG: AAA family ATPase [Phycisphaerales bacterium]|nr:AAA family ATPase [Phycisphaerales bacterium]
MIKPRPTDAEREARIIASSGPPAPHSTASFPSPGRDGTTVRQAGLITVRMSDVEPEVLMWLWPGRVPLGKLTLIAGDPGLGKSFITMDMAARITRGEPWPDGAENVAGEVVVVNVEDGLADTIRPRLDAAGADPSRVHAITGVQRTAMDGEATFSIVEDLPRLEALLLANPGVRAIFLDPISALLGDVDSHKNADIRAMLAPLAALAERHHAAVIGVTHLNKNAGGNAVYRTTGSLAFPAAARAAWLVAPDPEDKDARILAPIKFNLGERPSAMSFSIIGKPGRVAWSRDTFDITADELLAKLTEKAEDASDGIDAVEWLRERLALGSVRCATINSEARQVGIGTRRLTNARNALGLKPWRKGGLGGDGQWWYSLPGQSGQSPQSSLSPTGPEGEGDSGDSEVDDIDGLPV